MSNQFEIAKPSTLDAHSVVSLVEDMVSESIYSEFRVNPGEIADLVFKCVFQDSEYFGRVIKVGDEIVGFFAGRIVTPPLCFGRIATDIGVYLKPEYRKTHDGVIYRAAEQYIDWAETNGATQVHAGISTGEGSSLSGLYRAMGGRVVGENFVWRLNDVR